MKKLSVLALLVAFVASAGLFAAAKVEMATGVVVSYKAAVAAVPADKDKGTAEVAATPAELVVKVGAKEVKFELSATVKLVGKDKKAFDVATLKAGTKVEVSYTVDKTNSIAASITLK